MSGDLQFMTAGGATAAGVVLSGGDAIVLATTTGTFAISIVGLPELAPTVDSLRGQTLAVTRIGSTSDFVARYWLRRIGAEPVADVPIIQVGGNPEMVVALATGAAQMVSATDLFALELQRQGYRELANGAEMGVEYIHTGLTTTRSYLATHEDVVRRYLRAAMRGQARFIADRATSVQVVSKYTQLDDQDVLGRAWELHAGKLAKRVPYTTAASMRLALDELSPTNEAARTADPEQFYDNRLVRELDESGFFKSLYPQ
jgi:ABC-type nitrate/sulfonate/bicarbonate transport system substrate-binding protein